MGVRLQQLKKKILSKLHVSRQTVLLLLGKYSTRVCVVLVWCGVLWSFVGTSAFPRISGAQQNDGQLMCLTQDEAKLFSQDLAENITMSALTVPGRNISDSYEVVVLNLNGSCRDVLEVQRLQIEDVNATGENSTSNVSILSINLPQMQTSLLYIPDGHFFGLAALLVFSSLCGFLAKLVFLPPLFGMIVAGFILRNVPGIDFVRDINPAWSSTIRNIALVIVLIRGGLALDPRQLKRLKLALLLLAFLPCTLEGAIDGVVATFYLMMPWQYGFTLGYVIAAISPGVIVPTMLTLQERGYGIDKGIPTLVVAAASGDVVISISLFGVFLGLAFSDGQLVLDIFRAPIQIILGVLYGVLFGLLLWLLPTKHFKKGSKTRNHFFLLFGFGLFALFGSRRVIIAGSSLAGAGALAVLILAFVAGQGWDKEEKALVSKVFAIVWQFAQPLLFGLIGGEVDIMFITPSLVGQGIALIVIGLVLRVTVSFLVVLRNGFTIKEMILIAVAWLPKATVQAAIGSIALEMATERNEGPEALRLGRETPTQWQEESLMGNDAKKAPKVQKTKQQISLPRLILTIAVLAIVLTAPLGAIAVSLLGPVLLTKTEEEEELQTNENHHVTNDDGPCGVQSQEQNISLPYSGDLISELDSSPRFLRKSFNMAEEHGVQDNCPQNDVKEEAV